MAEPLHVHLAERSYPIHFDDGRALRQTLAALRADGREVAVIADRRVAGHPSHRAWIHEQFGAATPALLLAGAETTKSVAHFDRALQWLAARRLDRRGAVFALGGGVVGDLAGFVAASYLRGVDFYQLPTTLLAMVDSSVGGKTGINLPAGKNLVGAFWQPRAVFVETRFLRTLPAREFACGLAEIIKYGLLGDAKLFAQLERGAPWHAGHAHLRPVIRRCCAIKAAIVGGDERELKPSGGRALLNLGHTFAHALENVTGYGAIKHGEAVGLGLVLAGRLSQRLGWIGADEVRRIEQLVDISQLPVRLARPLRVARLVAAIRRDKKVRGGRLRFVALRRLGRAETVDEVPAALVRELWRAAGAR